LEGIAMTEQEILEALEEWQNLSVDPENRYAYEMRLKWLLDQLSNIRGERQAGLEEGLKKGLEEGLKKGIEEGLKIGLEQGREEGREKGREEGMKEVIGKMIEKGMSIAEIANILDLTEEEVRKR